MQDTARANKAKRLWRLHMRRTILLFAILLVPCLFATDASAVIRTTTISTESAEAFCHGHGGGTNCVFCHRDHCHVISCTGGFCTNTVSPGRKKPGQSVGKGRRAPSTGVKSTGNGSTKGPVKTGFKPPSGVKTTGNSQSGATTVRSAEHHAK